MPNNDWIALIDQLPEEAEVNGRVYQANTDFRSVLAYQRLRESEETENDKTILGLTLFFGDGVLKDDANGLLEWLDYFLSRGKFKDDDDKNNESKKSSEPPAFDLLFDSGRVWAAVLQVYGINLRTKKLHWWLFMELLDNLPGGTGLAEVMHIRREVIDPKRMKPAERNRLQKLKNLYAIGKKQGVFDALDAAFGGF